jgi:hypothetical protein
LKDKRRVEGNAILFANERTVDDALEPSQALRRVRAGIVAEPFFEPGAFKARVFAECTPHTPFVYESTFRGVESSAGSDPRAEVVEALAMDAARHPTLVVVRTESVDDGVGFMRLLRETQMPTIRDEIETREAFEARVETFKRNFDDEELALTQLVERVQSAGGHVVEGTRNDLMYRLWF